MRLFRLVLALEAVALVQSTHSNNATRGPADGGLRLNARNDPTGHVRWTLERSCTEDPDPQLKFRMIEAMKQATDRSRLSVETLTAWKTECPNYAVGSVLRAQCELLMGPVDERWAERCDKVIRHLQAAANIEGPIGHTSGEYAESPEWKALAESDDHYLNFVVYCEADVGTVLGKDGTEEKDRVYDYGLYQKIFKTKSLARIYAETKANRRDPQSPRNIIATTNQHVSDDMAGSPPTGIKPIPDKPGQRMPRTRIAATITFHPLYLDEHRRQNFEHAVMGEDAYTSTEVMTPVRGRSHKLPIEMLRGLSGVLHHELFHLRGIGRLLDYRPRLESFYFQKIRDHKDNEVPDFYVFVGLQAELLSRNLILSYEGHVSRMP